MKISMIAFAFLTATIFTAAPLAALADENAAPFCVPAVECKKDASCVLMAAKSPKCCRKMKKASVPKCCEKKAGAPSCCSEMENN